MLFCRAICVTAAFFFACGVVHAQGIKVGGTIGGLAERAKKAAKSVSVNEMKEAFGKKFDELVKDAIFDPHENMIRLPILDGNNKPTDKTRSDASIHVHENYGGGGISGPIGREVSDLRKYPLMIDGKKNDLDKTLSSAKVADNAKLILYDDFDFKGESLEITSDHKLFSGGWNDRARSFRIVKR